MFYIIFLTVSTVRFFLDFDQIVFVSRNFINRNNNQNINVHIDRGSYCVFSLSADQPDYGGPAFLSDSPFFRVDYGSVTHIRGARTILNTVRKR